MRGEDQRPRQQRRQSREESAMLGEQIGREPPAARPPKPGLRQVAGRCDGVSTAHWLVPSIASRIASSSVVSLTGFAATMRPCAMMSNR